MNIVYLSNVYKCIVRRGCFDAEVGKILFLKWSLKAESDTCMSTCPLSALSQVHGMELNVNVMTCTLHFFHSWTCNTSPGSVTKTAWWSILCLFQELNGLHCFSENWEETCCRLSGCRLQCKKTQVIRGAAAGLAADPRYPHRVKWIDKLDLYLKIYIDLKLLQLQPSFRHWNVFKFKKRSFSQE